MSSTIGTIKPKVVGIYGVSGSGKTYLLNQIKQELGQVNFAFYDGSDMLERVVPGGLQAFQLLESSEKDFWRGKAIERIAEECKDSSRIGVVAGHAMLWMEDSGVQPVYTQNDLNTYTHIFYLQQDPTETLKRRQQDTNRRRLDLTVDELCEWQKIEQGRLRQLCLENNILFSCLTEKRSPLQVAIRLLADVQKHSEEHNFDIVTRMVDRAIYAKNGTVDTVIVLDADKTLAAEDATALFWKDSESTNVDQLKTIFSSRMGYSHNAFRQATLQYEERADDMLFETLCIEAAEAVTIRPDFISLLNLASKQDHVMIVVITCGLQRIWEHVLHQHKLNEHITIFGGGRLADGYVITPEVKGALIDRMRKQHNLYVWAFGDSPVDLPMLKNANEAVVVVGEEKIRSTTMKRELEKAIDQDGLKARQALFPTSTTPLLDGIKLPLLELKQVEQQILQPNKFQFHQATDKPAAKLLMTPMRDAAIQGPALREAHRRVGWYLATEYLSTIIGTEEVSIRHVNGKNTTGHRFKYEHNTTIVPFMRGGEPMAFGVSDALPHAMFHHAKNPSDVTANHLNNQKTVILVDSVINTGKSIFEFTQYVRDLNPSIHIIIVAGVVQNEFLKDEKLKTLVKTSLVALRVSENKYTGRGGTDTGHRLFGTTRLD